MPGFHNELDVAFRLLETSRTKVFYGLKAPADEEMV